MYLTGAFFANHTQEADGFLFVNGGVWNHFWAELNVSYNLPMVVLVQSEIGESDTSPLKVSASGPNGAILMEVETEITAPAGVTNSFLPIMFTSTFSAYGRHSFQIGTREDRAIAISLDIRPLERQAS